MDFTLDERQQAIAGLAAQVLGGGRESWPALAESGLLALALPEELGGDGLGIAEVAVLLAEVGRAAVPGGTVPALATLALGALPVDRLGDPAQRAALLPEVATGERVLTAALHEPSAPMTTRPATTATPSDGGWRLTGAKTAVPYAASAYRVLVPATMPGGAGIFLVDPHAEGVALTATPTASDDLEYALRLDGALLGEGDLLGTREAGEALPTLHRFALAGMVAVGDGALAGALALTTEHLRTREQFGRPLATFQAVAQEVADVYIASRTVHLAALSAAWRLAQRLDPNSADAVHAVDADLAVAAYWLAEQAPPALAACHHLHGGVGLDVTYALHRYSSLVKDLARGLGGFDHRLDRLGEQIGGS